MKVIITSIFLLTSLLFAAQIDTLWYSSFGDETDWVLSTYDECIEVVWQIGQIEAAGDYPTGPIESTTMDDGWAIVDPDLYNGPCDTLENAQMTTANPIDISNTEYVLVEFETWYRPYTSDEGFLIVSTNNTDWPEIFLDTDVSEMPNVFQIYYSTDDDPTENPMRLSIDVSDVAGNQPQVWFRFVYTGHYGYTWFIDDFYIMEETEFDLKINDTFISHFPEDSIQYAQIPISQLDETITIKIKGENLGYGTQTNVVLNVDFIDENSNIILNSIQTIDEVLPYEDFEFNFEIDTPLLSVGEYNINFEVTADDEDPLSVFYINNSIERQLNITDDYFALDGVGLYTDLVSSFLGPGSYYITSNCIAGGQLLNYYRINQPENIYGVQISFSNTTLPFVNDTISLIVVSPDSIDQNISTILVEELGYIITEGDSINGFVNLGFSTPMNIENDGLYYGIKTNSNSLMLDLDNTIEQHENASQVLVIAGAWNCTNFGPSINNTPNSFGIRLLLSDNYEFKLSVNNLSTNRSGLTLFQNVPNPANGFTIIEYSLDKNEDVTLKIFDLNGKLLFLETKYNNTVGIHTFEIDVSNFPSGMYTYTLSNGKQSLSKKMIVK